MKTKCGIKMARTLHNFLSRRTAAFSTPPHTSADKSAGLALYDAVSFAALAAACSRNFSQFVRQRM